MSLIDFGIRSVPPCADCDSDGHCTMNCGPAVPKAKPDDVADICNMPSNATRKLSIDAIEKILNADRGDDIVINTDGTIGFKTEAQKAEAEHDRELYRDNLIRRLTEENARLKAALKALTDKF